MKTSRYGWMAVLVAMPTICAWGATAYTWSGGADTNWMNAANWSGSIAPTGTTSDTRLQVYTTGSANPLYYTADMGTTVFAGTGSNPRPILIALGASYTSTLYVTGGTLEGRASGTGGQADIIGGNGGTGRMIIDGGTYIHTNAISGSEGAATVVIGYGSTAGTFGELIVSNGLAMIREIRLTERDGASVTGIVRLVGGTLELGQMTVGGSDGGRRLYLDGGTLKAYMASTDWIRSGVLVFIGNGGARIDTAGYDVTLGRGMAPDGVSTGGLLKVGAGGLTLSAGDYNTYVGDTVVSNGTLLLGANNSLPHGAGVGGLVVAAGATFDLASYSARLNGLSGDGVVDNTVGTGTCYLKPGEGDASSAFNGVIQNTSGKILLDKTGAGTLVLGGSNTYSGGTTVSGGVLQLGAANVIPDGSSAGNVSVAAGATLDLGGFSEGINGLTGDGIVDNTVGTDICTLTFGGNNSSQTFNGTLQNTSGILALTKVGSGTETLGGSNTFDGLVTVSSGALRITDPHALGSLARGTLVSNGGQLELSGGITVTGEVAVLNGSGNNQGAMQSVSGTNEWAGAIVLGSDARIGVTGGDLILSGVIGDGGNHHDLILRSQGGNYTNVVELRGANTYGGRTIIYQGILRLGGNDRLPVSGLLQFGVNDSLSGRLDLNGWNQQVGGLILDSGVTDPAMQAAQIITNSAVGTTSTFTINNSADYAFAGSILEGAGSIALVKRGAGTMTLGGTNTYAGTTTVEAGTLRVDGVHAGGGLITVEAGAALGGTGTVGAVRVETGATLGAGDSVGTLTFTDDVEILGVLAVENSGADVDLLAITGNLTLGAASGINLLGTLDSASYTIATFTGNLTGTFGDVSEVTAQGYQVNYNAHDITLTIPEPGTAGLVGGAVLLALLRRRRAR